MESPAPDPVIREVIHEPSETVEIIEPPPPMPSLAQVVIIVIGAIAFLYYGRPVVLPITLAVVISMTLKPVVRWMANHRIPPALGAAILLGVFVVGLGYGFVQLGRPAAAWLDAAPQHITQLKSRMQKMFNGVPKINEAAEAVASIGVSEEEKEKRDQQTSQTVVVKQGDSASSIFDWTSSFVICTGETLILVYLILAGGDIFLQKLVHITPKWKDKKSAVEISHQIQKNLSIYIFSVSLINLCMGLIAWFGFYSIGVPNSAMWGMLVCVLNFVPFLGPICGILLLGVVGILSFDTLGRGLMPGEWYLLLHILEASFVTPILLGRRFTLNPVVIFASLLFWTWLWGIPGALLSVPILVSMKVICEHVPALRNVGQLITE